MPKHPTIVIPQFTGSSAQEFRSHKLQLDTIFHTLDLLDLFEGIETYPSNGSRNRREKYDKKSRHVNHVLTQSFSRSPAATSIISNHKLGRWRDYWKDLITYYDNETELASVNYQEILTNIRRNENEGIKDFIIRLDNAITNCRSHKIEMSESLLKSKLKSNTKGYIKSMVISQISAKKTFSEIKSEVLNMSNSDPTNELDEDNSTIYVSNNQVSSKNNTLNSDKSVFKSHTNLIKNKFHHQYPIHNSNNNHHFNQNNNFKICNRCHNYGHLAVDCKTNLSLKCKICGKLGHTEQICRNRNNIQSHTVSTNPTNNANINNTQFEQLINLITPLTNNTNTSNNGNTTTTRPMRTITFSPTNAHT